MGLGKLGQTLTAKEILDLVKKDLERVEREITLESVASVDAVTTIARYLQDGGGKRLRPILVLLASHLVGGVTDSAIRMAAVVEMIHAATLVHDDVIDSAKTRRGRPSSNAIWGNHTCVLAGDWLYMQAFQVALRERNFHVLDLLIALTQMMVEGELLQLERIGRIDISEADYMELVDRKTASLFSACTRLGALTGATPGGADEATEARLGEFSWNLGIAFQLVDDVLDFTVAREGPRQTRGQRSARGQGDAAADLCAGTGNGRGTRAGGHSTQGRQLRSRALLADPAHDRAPPRLRSRARAGAVVHRQGARHGQRVSRVALPACDVRAHRARHRARSLNRTDMPRLIASPTRIPVPGNKLIEEYIGRVNSKDSGASIAHMHSPSGWSEPGQTPEFDEFTVVLKGTLRVESKTGVLDVKAGQAVVAAARRMGALQHARVRKAPSTSRFACPPSAPTRSTATSRATLYFCADVGFSLANICLY